jgi:hypothetical protein
MKKKWIFLFLATTILIIFLYFIFFHKSYAKDVVPKSANAVIALDVKEIMQSVIWQKVSGGEDWHIKGSGRKLSGLDKAIKIPDYIFIFHSANQPTGAFYAILEISDEEKFQAFLKENAFVQAQNIYSADSAGIDIVRSEQKILLGFALSSDKTFIQAVAKEVFQQKTFVANSLLEKMVVANNHATLWVDKNETLTQEALIVGNIEADQVHITGILQPNGWQNLAGANFDSIPQSVLTMGIAQVGNIINHFLPASTKESINKVLNANIDSLSNFDKTNLLLDFVNVTAKKDTIISTTFDNDFNELKKEVVQEINEPNFACRFYNMPADASIKYLKNKGTVIDEKKQLLFTPMPLVKTWAETDSDGNLNLRSANYKTQNDNYLKDGSNPKAQNDIVYLFLQPYLLNPATKPYLPIWMAQNLQAIQSIKINLQKQNDGLLFDLRLVKRKN